MQQSHAGLKNNAKFSQCPLFFCSILSLYFRLTSDTQNVWHNSID